MKDVPEFEIALRAMRIAAHHVQPWNFAFAALENFLLQNKFCEEDLKHDPQPARTLCQFTDFALSENANGGTGQVLSPRGKWRPTGGASSEPGHISRTRQQLPNRRSQCRKLRRRRRIGSGNSRLWTFATNGTRTTVRNQPAHATTPWAPC